MNKLLASFLIDTVTPRGVSDSKVVGEAPGKELREKSYSFKEAANILGIVK